MTAAGAQASRRTQRPQPPRPSRPSRPQAAEILQAPSTGTARAIRSEWVKFATLPSHLLTAGGSALLISGFAGLLVWARGEELREPTVTELLSGTSWAQLLIGVLGAAFACTEWASGTSRITFLATPLRWPVLLGKAAVMGCVAVLVGVVGAAGALLAGAVGGISVDADPGLAVRLLLGAGAYLAGIAILAVALGAIVRNLVGGILTVVGFLWVLPLGLSLVPWEALQRALPYLPAPAGGALLATSEQAGVLTPATGGAILFAWGLGAWMIAAATLRASDV